MIYWLHITEPALLVAWKTRGIFREEGVCVLVNLFGDDRKMVSKLSVNKEKKNLGSVSFSGILKSYEHRMD